MVALPGLPVSVDDSRESLGLSTYLLTHMHTDHLKGLRDGWKGGTIYCTRITRELLLTRFDISPSRVVSLDVDDVGHVLKAQDPCTGGDIWFNLTVIDANHCPGSAMFLIKSESSGCILHTGDFRACPEMLTSTPLKDAKVDLLIMDNTYCHPKHALPPQSEALESIIKIAARHSKTHRILIGLDGLGKEEVLVALAEALHTHVSIPPKRMHSIKTCGFPTDRCTRPPPLPSNASRYSLPSGFLVFPLAFRCPLRQPLIFSDRLPACRPRRRAGLCATRAGTGGGSSSLRGESSLAHPCERTTK